MHIIEILALPVHYILEIETGTDRTIQFLVVLPRTSVFKGVHADEPGGVHADVKGNVPRGAAEGLRQIFGQHVLAGRLAAGEQQVLAAQQRGDGGLPDLFPIIMICLLYTSAQR